MNISEEPGGERRAAGSRKARRSAGPMVTRPTPRGSPDPLPAVLPEPPGSPGGAASTAAEARHQEEQRQRPARPGQRPLDRDLGPASSERHDHDPARGGGARQPPPRSPPTEARRGGGSASPGGAGARAAARLAGRSRRPGSQSGRWSAATLRPVRLVGRDVTTAGPPTSCPRSPCPSRDDHAGAELEGERLLALPGVVELLAALEQRALVVTVICLPADAGWPLPTMRSSVSTFFGGEPLPLSTWARSGARQGRLGVLRRRLGLIGRGLVLGLGRSSCPPHPAATRARAMRGRQRTRKDRMERKTTLLRAQRLAVGRRPRKSSSPTATVGRPERRARGPLSSPR